MHFRARFAGSHLALLLALLTLPALPLRAANDQDDGKESELIGVLQSDAPKAQKAITCKQLAVYGTQDAVPALAPLLADEQLASWARIALEVIPGPEADAALREAASKLTGRLLIGTMNSIGVRRDDQAVEVLAERLQDQDAAVAAAAAVALGHIGNEPATRLLRQSLASGPDAIRSAVAEGCILSAERLWINGQSDEAAAIYDEVRQADVPKQRTLEATRGAILARKSAGIPLLVEQLRSADRGFFQLGLTVARELSGRDVADALTAELAEATPDRGALLLVALADRGDTAALPVVLQVAEGGPQQMRVAAIGVLQRLGDASCVPVLLEIAIEEESELSQTAKETLAGMPGADVDAEITTRLAKAQGKTLPLLIELVGLRQLEATADLLEAVAHADAQVRSAALTALGATVRPQDLSVLITQVAAPRQPLDVQVARQALRTACIRMPDREACAEQLVAAMPNTSLSAQTSFLEILGAMGGTQALQAMGEAAKSDKSQLQDTASRLLGEWMTVDAGPLLLELAENPENRFKIRALRGYIRLARQFRMSDPQRAEMCRNALNVSNRADERKLVLQVIERYPSVEMLQLAVSSAKDPALKEDATRVSLVIAQKLGGNSAVARQLLEQIGQEPVKLEIIKAEYGAGEKQTDVTETLRRYAGNLPLIALASPSYNASFGGDPVPGTVKHLRIEYRINGKTREASFPENAVILLPK